MSDRPPLMVADLEALRRKFAAPPAGLDEVYARFTQRLAADAEFRARNLYLSALLGDAEAIAQARDQVLAQAADFGTRPDNDYHFDCHTWCSAAPGMRLSVYFDWLDRLGCWSAAERAEIARHLLHFGYVHCVNTLRSRFPMADNQSLSMSLYCAVTGWAHRDCPEVAERALTLHEYGMSQLEQRQGLALPDGYMLEGSTYQCLVVAPLAMWTGAFLSGLLGPEVLARRWQPSGTRLLDVLHVEACLPSPGLLLPPWDHYGWQRWSNVAALTYYATATGQPQLLDRAAEMWDRPDYIAWVSDDRMWSLLFWPEEPLPRLQLPTLTGWALPRTAAAVDHQPLQSRLMLAWDRCSFDRQGLSRCQVNPNHVMYEVGGVPLFADGVPDQGAAFLESTPEATAALLTEAERALIAAQFGSVEKWAVGQQAGLIGASNSVIVDREFGYFPATARRGQLVGETRRADLRVVTAESLDYYAPHYDLTTARRTVATHASGLSWIVDDYRADGEHLFTWQAYLRKDGELRGNSLVLRTEEGVVLSLAWLPVETVRLEEVPSFPTAGDGAEGRCWPAVGSDRLQLDLKGREAGFVVCLLPGVEELAVSEVAPGEWRAEWPGGSETFRLPASATADIEPLSDPPHGLCDCDLAPFDLPDDPTPDLLAQLQQPDPDRWRETVRAMQALVERGVGEAYPLMQRLLRDTGQRYQVTSVAAWALGRAGYAPALEDLRFMANSAETNTRFRSACAVRGMEKG